MQTLTKEQAVVVTGFTGFLIGSFSDFHKEVEARMGRPVFTHEFPSLSQEIRELFRADFLEMQPEDL